MATEFQRNSVMRCRSKAACPGEEISCELHLEVLVCDMCEPEMYFGRSMDVCQPCGNLKGFLIIRLVVVIFMSFPEWLLVHKSPTLELGQLFFVESYVSACHVHPNKFDDSVTVIASTSDIYVERGPGACYVTLDPVASHATRALLYPTAVAIIIAFAVLNACLTHEIRA